MSFFNRIFLSGLLVALILYEYIILKGMDAYIDQLLLHLNSLTHTAIENNMRIRIDSYR